MVVGVEREVLRVEMHQRRGAGGGVRACGARARDRERRGARAAERDSIADGTAEIASWESR